MSNVPPTSYAELANLLEQLPLLVHERRRTYRLSLRAAAKQAGVSFSTMTRFEKGQDAVLSNALLMLRWLDKP